MTVDSLSSLINPTAQSKLATVWSRVILPRYQRHDLCCKLATFT